MQTVAVIFGGKSAEHDVSVVTALGSVIRPLELTKRYNVEAVYISKDGAWFWGNEYKDIKLFTSGKISEHLRKCQPISVVLDGGLTLSKANGIRKTIKKIDVVFPAMHGTNGEDGALMGLLEMAGVPYVGSGMSASVIAMDKVLSKQIASLSDIPVTPYLSVNRTKFQSEPELIVSRIENQLSYPLFVKPAHLGSSIGISRATSSSQLQSGLEVATHYDTKVIVEEEVPHLIEVTLPIMGNSVPRPAFLEQPLAHSDDFFDFESKYMHGGKKNEGVASKGSQGYSVLPADLPKALYDKAQATALAVYSALECTGIARVDLLINSKESLVYFNEVNPMPGSLYAHNWRASGVSSVDLVESLVDLAVERHKERQTVSTTFDTNYLKQF